MVLLSKNSEPAAKFAGIRSLSPFCMRISIVQSNLLWEDPTANRTEFARKLASLAGQTDLVVLPEMFTSGFSMNAAVLAEPMDGPTMHWLAEQAARLNAAITGSFICLENDRFYNRLVFMRPDGRWDHYDKRHLFTLAREHETFTPGKSRTILTWQGWRICPLVCYDLRFPAWSRQPKNDAYDMLLYVANWPARRGHHWRSLLPARAIENQCFVAAVNIVGTDGAGLDYVGDSCIWDYSGQVICRLSVEPGIYTAELNLAPMQEYRRQLAFLDDADRLSIL